jgi:hypothetical protein
MLSSRLIQYIEDHCEQITQRVIRKARQDPKLKELQRLGDAELRERCEEILRNLATELVSGETRTLSEHYESLGSRRCHEGLPLAEIVHALHLIREEIVAYVRDQGVGQTSVDLYAEEELENSLARFFDIIVYHVVLGYEARHTRQQHVTVHA